MVDRTSSGCSTRFRLLLGRRLRAGRVAVGFSLDDFADELGLAPEEYALIENGQEEPDLETLVYAAKIMGKSLDFLLTGHACSTE